MTALRVLVKHLALPAWLIACIVLGGSSMAGLLANAGLQLAGIAIVVGFLFWRDRDAMAPAARSLLILLAVMACLLGLTLIPLPSAIWQMWPGRAPVAQGFAMAGVTAPWIATSLTPDGTVRALLSLLPPLATFLLALRASPESRRLAIIVLVALAAMSIIFGVMQQIAGYRSDLYIYALTSRGGAVGFFSNRNHLATLCLMTMPFVAALAVAQGNTAHATRLGQKVLAGGAFLLVALGALVVQSLAGWLLLVPALLGCLLVYRPPRRGGWTRLVAPAAGLALAAAALTAMFAPIAPSNLDRTLGEIRPQQRQESMRLTWAAAKTYFPIGSGFGSFVQVYPRHEDPAATTSTYVNHAHNDLLELLLEGGIFGLALAVAFAAWAVRQARRVWRGSGGGGALARAASVAIAMVVAHSLVDYPLRTAAIGCVFALACALLADPRGVAAPARERQRPERRTGTIMLGKSAVRAPAR